MDEIVCGTGLCIIDGSHSSQIPTENDSFTFMYSHFGLQKYTTVKQLELIQ